MYKSGLALKHHMVVFSCCLIIWNNMYCSVNELASLKAGIERPPPPSGFQTTKPNQTKYGSVTGRCNTTANLAGLGLVKARRVQTWGPAQVRTGSSTKLEVPAFLYPNDPA